MNYKIGYGKPPKNNQFKEGISGNYKGRPVRKSPNNARSADMITSFDKVLRRKIEVNEGGVMRTITILEALINKQIRKALVDGDQKALAQVFSLAEKVYRAVLEGRTEAPMRIIVSGGLPDD
jgi:hypothetical protein